MKAFHLLIITSKYSTKRIFDTFKNVRINDKKKYE